MPYDVSQLLKMTSAQLDDCFKSGAPGPIPNGEAKGTAIVAPGTVFTKETAAFISIFTWQGKTFDAQAGVLRNRISVFGISAIVAKVYQGASWFDNKECVVLDYSETSMVAHWVRDEIRLISPGLYLGLVYWKKDRLIHFALEF
ncbi:hypothetical protein EDE15_0941 [Edaphobacter aggregans]|uniref:Uncharacterized protein n=1 Tax=Edaphobacter aggregans TaxID=570835 RepID=A0A3R9QFR3_9BACT|nr:hypothetical protein [Edaphobacter aggregans]RSL15452.1 hypothetical protein EDE15_0941 [Edaphobacter aggregans]